jgi:hypothetical protein
MSNKISYSQYSMWANCPKSWQLKYVDGHRLDDSSIHTIFGTACHESIQEWLDVLYNQSETMAKTMYLHDGFKEKLLNLFKENTTIAENGEKVFLADKKTLMEFYEHGCLILTYLQENYKKIFPTINTKLHSIEYPLNMEVRSGVQYIGYIDVVTYNEATKKYVLYDLKTSRSGWTQSQKNDPLKVGQLLLYKRFFSQQLGIDEKDISVEFIILKRTIMENSQYHIPRISKFEPSNGAPSVNKSWNSFQQFINTCFDENGQYITEQLATPSKDACRWCKFRDKKELCALGVSK